jgi:hypothetical protein
MYIVAYFISVYNFSDNCPWVETQMHLFNIISYSECVSGFLSYLPVIEIECAALLLKYASRFMRSNAVKDNSFCDECKLTVIINKSEEKFTKIGNVRRQTLK